MGGLIDLNIVNDKDEDHDQYSSSLTSNSSNCAVSRDAKISSFASSSVCMELWHACAGPLIFLPKKGSAVVYHPQGHHLFETAQFGSTTDYTFPGVVSFDKSALPPPHVFCRVIDVKLHAEVGTDEVYAQVSLIPETQIEEKLREGIMDSINTMGGDGEDDNEEIVRSNTPHMFCKTLTASDTSTHGGFSVPRRAAEDCFPPLDYKQQRPSQELVAKDLHGLEWRFRHIYRGQPRRHLLTTGWSAFVNRKKLVSGDAVLFLRGADGELRLGIRRAAQVKACGAFPSFLSEQTNRSNPKGVLDAISTLSVFNVFYNPRLSSSEFIIPLRRFMKSLNRPYAVGMRFKMRFEAEDASERRFTGVITGVSEMDPVRWPGSKWKCLLVRWDDMEANRHSRISPWEIEPCGPVPCSSNNSILSGLKRSRIGLHVPKPDYPIPACCLQPDGTRVSSDWGEQQQTGPRKVLQGQEMMGFSTTTHSGSCSSNHPIPHPSSSSSGNCFSRGIGYGAEAFRPQRVLQGQEIHCFSSNPGINTRIQDGKNNNNNNNNKRDEIYEGVKVQSYGYGNGGWSILLNANANQPICPSSPSQSIRQVSSPSSVLMFQQAASINSGLYSEGKCYPSQLMYGGTLRGSTLDFHQHQDGAVDRPNMNIYPYPRHHPDSVVISQSKLSGRGSEEPRSKSSCRLFGFSLTEGTKQGGDKEGNCAR